MKIGRLFGRAIKVASVSIALVVTLATSPAMASTVSPVVQRDQASVVSVSMTLDCVNMTPKARTYADAHGLCASHSTAGGVSPMNVVPGNCGESWIYLVDKDNGYGSINYGFNSSQGNVIYRNLVVSYAGQRSGNVFPDAAWMNGYYFQTGQVRYMGYGWASVVLGGSVTLWWGGVCNILSPTSRAYL